MANRKAKTDAIVVEDERFKSVDSNRFVNKPAKIKKSKEAVPGLLKPRLNVLGKGKIDKNQAKKVKNKRKM